MLPQLERPTVSDPDPTTLSGARTLALLLTLVAILFPRTSVQKRYHCRETGARDLPACCCTPENDRTTDVPSSCATGASCASEERRTEGDCGCCDVALECSTAGALLARGTADFEIGIFPAALLPAHRGPFDRHRLSVRVPESISSRWSGAPIFLLCRSLLI